MSASLVKRLQFRISDPQKLPIQVTDSFPHLVKELSENNKLLPLSQIVIKH